MAWLIRYVRSSYRNPELVFTETKMEMEEAARVRYFADSNSGYYGVDLEILLNQEYFSREKAEKVREKVEEIFSGELAGYPGAYDLFRELMELFTELVPPYTTPAITVKKMEDTGGDYPTVELEFEYWG